MKKLIFVLILVAFMSQIEIVKGINGVTRERQIMMPGIPAQGILIFGPELSARSAIQKLQPPKIIGNEELNKMLENIHDSYMLLLTRNLDRPTLNNAKQEIERLKQILPTLKQKADAAQLPALKRYFLNLVSIARKKLQETWQNRETGENLDIILDADFTLDPLITSISKSLPESSAQMAPMETPVTPPPLPPSQASSQMPIESATMSTMSYPGRIIPIKPNIPTTRPIGPLNPIGHWRTLPR